MESSGDRRRSDEIGGDRRRSAERRGEHLAGVERVEEVGARRLDAYDAAAIGAHAPALRRRAGEGEMRRG